MMFVQSTIRRGDRTWRFSGVVPAGEDSIKSMVERDGIVLLMARFSG
jgi:hypothetical protein